MSKRTSTTTRLNATFGALVLVLGLIAASVVAGSPPTTSAAEPVAGADVGVLTEGHATGPGPIQGLIDTHAHLSAGEAFGGALRCGRTFAPGGIAEALGDCAPHSGLGHGALLEAILGQTAIPGGTQGWPGFVDWPVNNSLLHEQAYYKGIERAWQGGLRVINNYLVGNRAICELYPGAIYSCDEMDQVRRQVDYLRRMEAYIDEQSGGPGHGWFRIARSPAEVREIAGQGKLAVTLGLEISELFGCREAAGCTEADVDAGLAELDSIGVSTVFPVHKFDNAFGGTRFDEGLTGAAVNVGNVLSAGHFWQTEPCTGPAADHDQPLASDDVARLLQVGDVRLPAGTHLPVYPEGPQCNVRGLSPLGAHLVRGMMDRGMLISLDHMSVKTARDVLDLTGRAGYDGIITDHTWSDPVIVREIRDRGGFLSTYGFPADLAHHDEDEEKTFVSEWRQHTAGPGRPVSGYGFASDVNGLAPLAPPRLSATENPLQYPFTAPNGAVMDRARLGERVYDLNTDGVSHYGLYPDWFADLLLVAGPDRDRLRGDLMNGAETFASLWESVG